MQSWNFLIRSAAHRMRSEFIDLSGTSVVLMDFYYCPYMSRKHFLAIGVSERYEVKYTTEKPIQLPTTPIAEYELVNIKGRN